MGPETVEVVNAGRGAMARRGVEGRLVVHAQTSKGQRAYDAGRLLIRGGSPALGRNRKSTKRGKGPWKPG